jgi:hypothetical protein
LTGVVLALLAGLPLLAAGDARGALPRPPAGRVSAKVKPLPMSRQFQQAQALRQVYEALAGANQNYGGHRVKAMAAIKDALGLLDAAVLNGGAPVLKTATRQGQAAVAGAEKVSTAPRPAKPQPVSDRTLRQARASLLQVRPSFVANKQTRVLQAVDRAVRHLDAALKVR